ncbi:MAG: CoA-binding protein, partial [Candidatus Hermodarchaeota archaeon]|nr:CoA-binding protein [Candidatus Hermodarchaeota archaeon]
METVEQQIDRFFNPRSVAIVGASRRPGRIGHIVVEQMVASKFPGRIYLINREAAKEGHHICGIKTYASLKDCSGPIDLVVIVIPAKYVPTAMQECVDLEIPNVIIVSGGFRETGPEGAKLEVQVMELAKKGNIRILGPNCLGTFSPHCRIDTLFLPESTTPRPSSGAISFLSQSGSVGGSVMSFAYNERIGFSKFASFGNAVDVDEGDLIDYLEDDVQTQVTGLYLESINRGR